MIKESELILNNDGTVYHLHLKPENIGDLILLVGDQDRVNLIGDFLEKIDISIQNREFRSITGWYKKKKLTILSTGIGTDNIDIVLNELDALVNIDLEKREIKKDKKSLNIVRIGTSGSLQEDIPVNSYVLSQKSIGFDGLLYYYANSKQYCDPEFEKTFKQYTQWQTSLPDPYIVDASDFLLSKFDSPEFKRGITVSAPGFYGPQGREIRLKPAMPYLNQTLEQFSYKNLKITNFEMESSAIYGLSKMLGHNALTVCLVIAQRITGKAIENYHDAMKRLIKKVIDNITL